MVLDQIWVGPNMGPTKYAGPNLVRPKMADQKCLDQVWLDTACVTTTAMESERCNVEKIPKDCNNTRVSIIQVAHFYLMK